MLFADARVGALCSGGVDSSLLMAVAAKSHGDLAIFHADVVGRESELDAATALARHLKLDLLTVQVHDQDFLEYFPDVLYHYEHPFSGHPHSVPFLMVSKLVRESGVKGVLTGEGSDECFLGYNHLPYEPLWRAYERALATVRGIVNRIPTFGARLWPHVTRPDLVADMLSQLSSTRELQNNRAGYATRLGCPPDRNVRTLDLLSYHLRTLLHRNDTMGMAASIEARFPFLDEPLVAAAINFPYRYKIRFSARVWEQEHPFLRDKWVVRRVADRYLPGLLSQRKKWGFGVSAIRRLKVRDDYFRESFVQRHFRLSDTELDVFLAQADAAMRTKLVMLDAWGRLFVDDEPLHAEKQRLLQFGRIEEAA